MGVDTSLLGLVPSGATPVVLEKITLGKNGIPRHRFYGTVPNVARIPAVQARVAHPSRRFEKTLGHPEVFYADRVSRSAVKLANIFARRILGLL